MSSNNNNKPTNHTLDKGVVSGSIIDNFISKFERDRNILKEDGYPAYDHDGWHCWNYWEGKIDEKTYKIRISKLYVIVDRWSLERKQDLIGKLTNAILNIATECNLCNPVIKDNNIRMINPDRCIYEATIHCN